MNGDEAGRIFPRKSKEVTSFMIANWYYPPYRKIAMKLDCQITQLNPECVRVQIAPEGVPMRGSALNGYGFIMEDAVRCAGEPRLHLERHDDAGDLLEAFDENHTLLFRLGQAEFSPESAMTEFELFDPDEDWIGFGDQTRERLFHRGFPANCQVNNVSSYIPVPFFMSTRGYAILVNTTFQTMFDMGCSQPDKFGWSDRGGRIDFYVWKGADFKMLLGHYTRLTGCPELPPKWSFGLWYIGRTQATDAEIMNDARLFREYNIPCDVMGLEPGWMEKIYDFSVDKAWSSERFPLPEWQKKCDHTFIRALKRMGYHLELWLCNEYDLSYEEERRIGDNPGPEKPDRPAFCRNAEFDEHFTAPRLADTLTKPDEAWFRHLEKFVDWGADFFKQDGANQVCSHPDRVWRGNNMSDREMHNLYPLLYSRQMKEGFARYTNRRPLVFTVCGWTGFQHHCGTWTGDTGGRIETLGAMLNTACVGHSWCTNDMEVAQREGIHFGYLLPWSQINSWTYFRMPWLQGRRLLKMHQDYARFRSRLMPYLYSSARCSTLTGLPMLMPLAIEFQSDRNCRNIVHEYLLGNDLLVTIYRHEVYLPRGEWKDLWSGAVLAGNGSTRRFDWPEDRGGGLFLRSGAIIPLKPVTDYCGETADDTIELMVFAGDAEHAEFELYDDDGVSFRYRDGEFSLTRITLDRTAAGWRIAITPDTQCNVKSWSISFDCAAAPAAVRNNDQLIAGNFDARRRELHLANVQPGIIEVIR